MQAHLRDVCGWATHAEQQADAERLRVSTLLRNIRRKMEKGRV